MAHNAQLHPVRFEHLIGQLKHYRSPRLIEKHVQSLLGHMRSLVPKTDQFVYNDGRMGTLIVLEGTVPIFWMSNQYNIPVAIWLPATYPSVPPMCYVRPTPGMSIKHKHTHVDPQGLVRMPYLDAWSGRSNLVDLVQQLSSIFSKEPPVFKTKSNSSVQPKPVVQHHQNYQPPVNRYAQPQAAASGVVHTGYQASNQQTQVVNERARLVQQLTRRLQSSLKSFLETEGKEINDMFERESRLQKGAEIIDNGSIAMLENKRRLEEYIRTSKQDQEELLKWLEENENADTPIDVNAIVLPMNVWDRQMFDCVAKDFSIEDTLYVLDRALADDRISLAVFLKKVRSLARDQFFSRALINKIDSKQKQLAQS